MAFTEFYCDPSSGSNLNGGSDSGTPSMADTAAGTGAVSTVSHTYTSVLTTGAVTVGQFIAIFSGAATVPAFVARITSVSGGGGSVWVITYSTTAIFGTEPTTGSSYKANVGGAWKGPNGAVTWPVGSVNNTMTDAAGDLVRVNLKNNASYAMTSGMTQNKQGVLFQGMTSTPGDGGRATIDGSTNAITIISLTGTSSVLADLIISNNGTTGTNAGVSATGNGVMFFRCVFHDLRGPGITLSGFGIYVEECEFYACNGANSSGSGAALVNAAVSFFRCIFHDNIGANNNGMVSQAGTGSGGVFMHSCIFDTNGKHGAFLQSSGIIVAINCDFYNNAGSGVDTTGVPNGSILAMNCNFVKNVTAGVAVSTAPTNISNVINCGFGSGTQANGSTTTGLSILISGSVTYASGVTPWVDPANGDFRINLAAAIGTGRGAFTQTAASYAGTSGSPVIGACQVSDYPAQSNVHSGTTYGNGAYTGSESSSGVSGTRIFSGM